nr:hypothetical protein [Tanacetum cinerariifolium]
MARQCTQLKRPRNATWFKEKARLAEAQEARQILDEEKLAFLADPSIPECKAAQTTISNTAAFQTNNLDAYDSDCDDVSNAKAILMANLSNYGSDVISEKAQQIKPTLYDGSLISSQHVDSLVIDDEETLILDSLSNNQNTLEILEYFENMDLKAQLQAKDTIICKLKEHMKSMREIDKEEKVKQEMDEIETINIELKHSVEKLLFENKRLHKEIVHLKKIYKDQFDSIKKTRALSKEHGDSLIAQLNSKSMKNVDLKCQIQDKVFVITSLKRDLQKLKRKETVKNAAQIPIANTITPGMFKIDLEPLSPSEKLIVATPMNKFKKVRFFEPLTSSSNIQQGSDATDVPSSSSLVNDSSGLVQNLVSPTPYVSPSKKYYEIMFQPLLDEYFNPPPCAVSLDSAVIATSRAVDQASSPSSTTIDQDVPSSSTSPTN